MSFNMTQMLFSTFSVALFAAAVFSLVHCLTPLWDRFTTVQMGKLSTRFTQLGHEEIYLRLALRLWTLLLVAIVIVFVITLDMKPLGIALALIAYAAPRRILDMMIAARERKFRKQLTVASTGLANAKLAGLSLQQCIKKLALESAYPLKPELEKIMFDNCSGIPLEQALANRRTKLALDSFTLFSLTIETTRSEGGDIAACLDSLSKSFQEEDRLQAKIESETSAGRQTIVLLSLFPPGFLGIGMLILPEGTTLMFTTLAGQCVLAAIAALVYFGYGWARHILKITV